MNFAVPNIEWTVIAPFLAMVTTGALALLWDVVFRPKDTAMASLLSLVGLCVAGALSIHQWGLSGSVSTFNDSIFADRLSVAFNMIIIAVTILAVLFAEPYLEAKSIKQTEWLPLLLFASSGAMLMTSSYDLIVVFLGLEILSISLYVLSGLSRREERSQEAAIKYFLLGAFASGFFLYGIAFIYGATGSANLDAAMRVLVRATSDQQTLLFTGLGLLIIGLGFKAAIVPFHMWTPDVYQGAPTAITGYMAVAVKVAAFAALFRVIWAFGAVIQIWQPVLFVLALLTMTVGNIVALTQTDAKRMLAYSSIAHAGYILVGIVAGSSGGLRAVLYYLVAYGLMTFGAFAVVGLMAKKGRESTDIRDMKGLWMRQPFATAMMVLFMASLAGIPPTAGFFGKFGLFQAAIEASQTHPGPIGAVGHITLAVALALNSAVSLFYYIGLARAMYVNEPEEKSPIPASPRFALMAAVVLCAVGVLYAGIAYAQVNGLVREAAAPFQSHQDVNAFATNSANR